MSTKVHSLWIPPKLVGNNRFFSPSEQELGYASVPLHENSFPRGSGRISNKFWAIHGKMASDYLWEKLATNGSYLLTMWVEKCVASFYHFHKLPLSLFAYRFVEQERNPVYLKKKKQKTKWKAIKWKNAKVPTEFSDNTEVAKQKLNELCWSKQSRHISACVY